VIFITSFVLGFRTKEPLISPLAPQDLVDLAKSIHFLLTTEFVNYPEAVFSWLDESPPLTVYVFGSNGELYALTREKDEAWVPGHFKNIPYEDFPN